MDSKLFYDSVRNSLFGGKISTSQFNGIESILKAISSAGIKDNRFIAYMLATAFHETAKTMQPIREYGKGQGYDYGKKLKSVKTNGKRVTSYSENHIYYGRGYVQLTWWENYKVMGRLLGIDLLNNPDLALNADVAAKIMIEGMTKGLSKYGDFTGVSLETYFNDNSKSGDNLERSWVKARAIINGTDQAERIAVYAKKFYAALNL